MSLKMTKVEREEFLAGIHVGIVSIGRSSKGPLTVPIWYDYEPGGDVWMVTSPESLKGRLLEIEQRASFCVQTETAPYAYVSIEGPIKIRPASRDDFGRLAVRYLGEEEGRAYAATLDEYDPGIVVSISPETWYSEDYSKQ